MAQVSIRIDDDIKSSAERTLDSIGLSMSSAITIFLKTVVRENRIPFELAADPFYSETNQLHLEKSLQQLRDGKGHAHELIEVDDE